jgi:hypothetical protein
LAIILACASQGLAACSSDDAQNSTQASSLDPASNGFPAELESTCDNPDDRAGFSQKIDGMDVQGHATVCGLQCLSNTDPSCNQTCLQQRIADLLSEECQACAVGVVSCITKNCFSDCLDPTSEACGRCACDPEHGNCRGLFSRCTGFENTSCG